MKIAIVGAGIMGQLTALALAKAGHELSIFEKAERDQNNNCSMAAAGMLSCLTELEKSELGIYELGKDSVENYWPDIIQQLPGEIYFSRRGTLLLSHPRDGAELERFVSLVMRKLPDKTAIQALDKEALLEREPELNKFDRAFYFSEEAQLDNQALLSALEAELSQRGVSWHFATEVSALDAHQLSYGNSVDSFDWVIDCRGLAAKDQFADLRGLRGELIWLKAPEVKITHLIRLLHPRHSLYIVPRPDQHYILGASEFESEDQSEISVRTALELLSAAYYVHPGFSEARVIKTVTHCRPTLRDHSPRIKVRPGLIAVNGLYRHGFLIAPALANDVLSFIEQGASALKYPHFWEEMSLAH